MRTILKWIFRLLFIAAAALAVSAIINLKREWELLSESEIRDRLAQKLAGRVSDEQVDIIQEKVVTYLKGSEPSFMEEAMTTTEEAAGDIAETAADITGE